MQAQLGNQMFQYAAIRTYAESTGSDFLWGYPATTMANHLRLCLGRMRRPPIRLRQYFALDGDSRLRQLWHSANWRIRRLSNAARAILPEYEELLPNAFSEKLVDLAAISSEQDLEFRGWFQTERYFLQNRATVLKWFTPVESVQRDIETAEGRVSIPPEQRCCIHVRRGDYLKCDAGWAGPEGWALPMAYYRNAWNAIPAGIVPIIITDDPDYCEANFRGLPSVQIVRNTSAITDLFLLRNSRYRIIANSTFSWWGAWLSDSPDSVTMMPEGFLGFCRDVWAPSRIKPESWIAVPCSCNSQWSQC
jgi:hypothetical protein